MRLVAFSFLMVACAACWGAPALPACLIDPYKALMEAPEGVSRDRACDVLLNAYAPLVANGQDVPVVDGAIAGTLAVESRSTLIAQLAIQGMGSPLVTACLQANAAADASPAERDRALCAAALVRGLKTLSGPGPRDTASWQAAARDLRDGWRYYPSSLYADSLDRAFRKAGDRRGAFEFAAYRYYDESGPNPLRWCGLVWRWLFLPQRQAFSQEIAAVKASIKNDILASSPPVGGLPRFGGDVFSTSDGQPRLLSFTDPRSPLAGKRAVFVFFQTTCGYCAEDIQALSRVLSRYGRQGIPVPTVVGIKLPTNLPPVIAGLAPFEKRVRPGFPLLENDASTIEATYGVTGVPLLLFLDERGVVQWAVAFRGQGRIEEKLSWFLDDFMADAPAAAALAPAGQRSLVVDVYTAAGQADGSIPGESARATLQDVTGVHLDILLHDAGRPAVARALQDRLIALRSSAEQYPVAIMGGRAIQGQAAIARELPVVMKLVARGP